MKLYLLLENLLDLIEKHLKKNLTVNELADLLHISPVHLQRLFKDAFGITLASYIRSRRLAMSLDLLLNSKFGMIDIATEYGFAYAQTYIKAFKNEFNMTPGEFRKSGKIVKVKSPLQLLSTNDVADGVLFGPEIVYVPEFYCIGRRQIISNDASNEVPAQAAREFWLKHRNEILNIEVPNVYIGLTHMLDVNQACTYYTPSVLVSNLSNIPAGFEGNVISAGMYAKFHYVGKGHPLALDADVAQGMYEAIRRFEDDVHARYEIAHKSLDKQKPTGFYFEKIAETDYDGTYCKMEWFSPVYEK